MSSPLVKDAIRYYHNLLSARFLNSTVELLNKAILERRLTFDGRSTCTVLRPFFVEDRTYSHIEQAASAVLAGISTASAHLIRNAELRRELELSELEEEVIQIDTGYGAPDVSGRLDGFLSEKGVFQFVEYNADSPGGLGFGDALADVFRSLPIMQEFATRYPFRSFPIRDLVLKNLNQAYRRWGGNGAPNIAIIDWENATTYNEFLLMQEHFRSHGCDVRIADPSELDYKNGKLQIQNFRVDLIYKRLLVGELIAKFGRNHPLLHAARDRAVCVVNGFGVQMLFKKTLFAILSDPVYETMFRPGVRNAYLKYIPWTRRVRESKTNYHEQIIDLIPYISKNQDRFVLKPNSEYGGKGVVLGWDCPAEIWKDTIRRSLEEPYVVQERVVVGKETYPAIEGDKLIFDQRYFDVDPYIWNGSTAEGSGVRLSSKTLLNVSAGGGSAVPLFVLSPS
jgi:hypothetical protein